MAPRIRTMIISAMAILLGTAGLLAAPATQASATTYRLTLVNLCPAAMKGSVYAWQMGDGALMSSGERRTFSYGNGKIGWKLQSKRGANGKVYKSSGSVRLTPKNPSATRYLCISW